MCFKEENLRMLLKLHGVFSSFSSSKPSEELLNECERVLFLTPESPWNLNTDAHSRNESSMLDYEGNVDEMKDRSRILVSDLEDNELMEIAAVVSKAEASLVNKLCHQGNSECRSIDGDLGDLLHRDGHISRFKTLIGSTNFLKKECLDDASIGTAATEAMTDVSDANDRLKVKSDNLISTFSEEPESVLDEVMASAAHARDHESISADTPIKIWRIHRKPTERTLEMTSQRVHRDDTPSLSRNCSTNDRMLRHKRADELFFMGTFFSAKEAKKSSRGNTCCQLFITDKEFVHVVPTKSKAEVLQALKPFAKEI